MTASTQAFAGLLGAFFVLLLALAVSRPSGGAGGVVMPTGMRVDPNTADAATLGLLPGIGPGIADHIIAARQAGAVFHNAGDLDAVKFIGPSLVERVRPWTVYGEKRLAGELARPIVGQATPPNTDP